MARHRTFNLDGPPDRADYPTFTWAGTSASGEPWTETFTAHPVAPAGVLEDLTLTIRVDPTTGMRRYNTPSCMAFMRAVLVPEDVDRFGLLMRDADRAVSLVELVQVTSWLSDEITARPTRPSSGSTPGGGPAADGAATPEGAAI